MKIRFPLILDIPKKLFILAEVRWHAEEGDGWGGVFSFTRILSVAISGWRSSREVWLTPAARQVRLRLGFLDIDLWVERNAMTDPPGVTITEREMP